MELELTQEIARLNSEVDRLNMSVTFWEEKSDHRKERIKELKEENEVLLDNNVLIKIMNEKQIKIMNENQSVKEINEKLKKKLERTEKEKNNHKKFVDIFEERMGVINNNYCCGHEPQYNIPMDEIDERLKIKDTIDLALGPLFKIIKHLKKERDFFNQEFHKTLQHQVDDKEQYEKEIEGLKEDNEKLKQKARSWDIVNKGSDWENLRDLCDKSMCQDLIECGECDKEDFEGYFEAMENN